MAAMLLRLKTKQTQKERDWKNALQAENVIWSFEYISWSRYWSRDSEIVKLELMPVAFQQLHQQHCSVEGLQSGELYHVEWRKRCQNCENMIEAITQDARALPDANENQSQNGIDDRCSTRPIKNWIIGRCTSPANVSAKHDEREQAWAVAG